MNIDREDAGSSGRVALREYDNCGYQPGATWIRRTLWYGCNWLLFESALFPFSEAKAMLLRFFGAAVGARLVIKPKVNIKYPWHLSIGDDVWIGEAVWIDNLGTISIGNNCCISQGAYLLTGNHDFKDERFRLMIGSIRIEAGSWIGAKAIVCPGVHIRANSVLCAGGVLTVDTESNGIYSGNPAKFIKTREIISR